MLSERRSHLQAMIEAALAAVEPAQCVRRAVQVNGDKLSVAGRAYDLNAFDRIRVIGAGKGAAAMAAGLEACLGERITEGRVTTKYGYSQPLRKVTVGESGHPTPDEAGLTEARSALEVASEAGKGDLVFCVISGGGSALWPAPVDGITLPDKRKITDLLLASGASINEINAVRKHLSQIKGGQLAAALAPATVISLLLSDVVGDSFDVIASGPTSPDRSTFADAWAVLKKYELGTLVPARVREYLQAGIAGDRPETPKPGDPIFDRVQNEIVGSNHLALAAAAERAERLGYRAAIITSAQTGATETLAKDIIERWKAASSEEPKAAQCLLWGGETTVVLTDSPGQGGRNQHLALLMARELDGHDDVVFASAGTDGTDGPTDASGGIVDGGTVARGKAAGLDLDRHVQGCDAYPYLKATGDLLVTGPTRTNVMDIQILLLGNSATL